MKLYVFITSGHSIYCADEVQGTNIITVMLIFTCVISGLAHAAKKKIQSVWGYFVLWEKERQDVDSKTLMMNDSPYFPSCCDGIYENWITNSTRKDVNPSTLRLL